MKKLLVALALLWSASALAQSPVTNVNGLDITANNAQAVSAAGHLRLRYNSGTNQLEQSIAGAAYTAVGGGGIAGLTTGRIPVATSATTIGDSNFTASANALDATGIVTIFGTNATALGIGGANLTGGFSLTGASLSTISTTSGNLNLSASNVLNLQSSSGPANFGNATGIINYRSGSTGLFDMSAANGVFKTPSGVHTFGGASWSVPANLVITGGSSATNTTAVANVITLADGATSVGWSFKNNTATTSASLMQFISSNNTVGAQIELDTIIGGSVVFRQPNQTFLAFFDSANDGFKIQSGNTYFRAAGTDQFAVIGTDFSPVGGGQTIGVNAPVGLLTSTRISQTEQNLGFSATPAFNCTLGNAIHIGTITGNITGPTMVSGTAGEQCTIVFQKDGTAGTYTITSSWGSNVRTTSSTFTSGAGSLVILHFFWDANLTTPAWVETSGIGYN